MFIFIEVIEVIGSPQTIPSMQFEFLQIMAYLSSERNNNNNTKQLLLASLHRNHATNLFIIFLVSKPNQRNH